MLTALRPNKFLIGRMPITGIALGWRQGVYYRLQGGKAAILADLLSDDQPGGAGDGDDDVDFVFFCWTNV